MAKETIQTESQKKQKKQKTLKLANSELWDSIKTLTIHEI